MLCSNNYSNSGGCTTDKIAGLTLFYYYINKNSSIQNLRVVSRIHQRIGFQPEKTTVFNPARGLLNREKRTKRSSLAAPSPPPPLPPSPTLLVRYGENKNKNKHMGRTMKRKTKEEPDGRRRHHLTQLFTCICLYELHAGTVCLLVRHLRSMNLSTSWRLQSVPVSPT